MRLSKKNKKELPRKMKIQKLFPEIASDTSDLFLN